MMAAMALLGACGSDDGATVNVDSATDDTTRDTATSGTATGDSATDDTTDQLPGWDEGDVRLPEDGTPVVQLQVQAMYPVIEPFLPSDWTTIYPDGTVLLPSRASAFAQPQVWPYEVGHIDTADVAALLMHADGYGLLDEPEGLSPAPEGTADASKTTLVLTTSTGSVTHEAIGLGLGEDATGDYRDLLLKVVGEIDELVMRGAEKPDDDSNWPVFYEPQQLDVKAVDVTVTDTGLGTNTVVDWTGGDVDLSTWSTCTTVDDPAVVSFLVGELAGPKFQQGDRLFRIASRVHPPGTSCD